MNNRFYILIFSFLILTYSAALGQGEFVVESSDIDDAEIFIEKKTVLKLPVASRIFEQMKKIESGKISTTQTYTLDLIPYKLEDIDPEIPAAGARRITEDPADRFYLAAGIGNYVSPYLDAFAGTGESDKYRAGVGLYHFSSFLGPVDGRNSESGTSQIDLFGEYFTSIGKFGAKAGFENRTVNFYGYADTLSNEVGFDAKAIRDSIKQSFNTIYGGITHEFDSESTFKINTAVNFYSFSDKYNAEEINLHIKTQPGIKLSDEMGVEVALEFILNKRTDTNELNRNLLKARPLFHLNKEKLQLQIGAGIAYNGDTTLTDKEFYIYPHLEAAYQVIENRFAVELSVIGDLKQQTLRGFTERNPFVKADLPLAHTDEALKSQLTLLITPINNFGVKLGGSYALQKNQYFFVNDFADATRFNILYEPENIGTLRAFGEMNAQFGGFRAILRESFYNYNLGEKVLEAWHRPDLFGELLLQYNHQNKINVSVDFYHMNGLTAFDPQTNSAVAMDDIIDLNLNGEYAINESITAFVKFRNLLAQKYQRYYHYPVRGVTVLAGGSISF